MSALLLGALITFIVTLIVTEGFIFSWLRSLAVGVHEHLGYLFSCYLCFGTWVGLVVGFLVDGPLHPLLDGLAYHALGFVIVSLVRLASAATTRLQY